MLGTDETLAYAPGTTDWSTLMLGACLAIIQFLGLVALLRAFWLLRLVGSGDLGRYALARATAIPSRVRILMRSASNSAKVARMLKNSLPIGSVGS